MPIRSEVNEITFAATGMVQLVLVAKGLKQVLLSNVVVNEVDQFLADVRGLRLLISFSSRHPGLLGLR
jgi:hypothetical protein